MDNVFNSTKKPNVSLFAFFMIMVIFFTTSDLVANINQETLFASLFSVLSGFFVFLGTALKKTQNIEKGINEKIDYINSNFNKCMVILSILDIICSIIALFTAVLAIGMIFRSLFILRLIVTLNKVKTVIQSIMFTAFGYLYCRCQKLKKYFKEFKMKKIFNKIGNGLKNGLKYIFISNPKATTATIVNAFGSAALGFTVSVEEIGLNMPSLFVGTFDVVPTAVSVLAFVFAEIFGVKYAFETNTQADARKTLQKLEKEKLEEEEKAKKLAEQELAKQKEEAEKAKALVLAKQKEEEIAKQKAIELAKQKEEEEKLLELGRKLLAQEQAEKEQLVEEDRPQ